MTADDLTAAQQFRRAGRFAEAATACRRAIAARPDDMDAISLLGGCLHLSGDRDGALACARATMIASPAHPSGPLNLGVFERAQNNAAGALRSAGRAIMLDPLDLSPWNNIGNLLYREGAHARAAAAFRHAAVLAPDRAASVYVVGLSAAALGEIDAAVAWYRRTLSADPADPRPFYELKRLRAVRSDETLTFHLTEATKTLDRVRFVHVGAAVGLTDDDLLHLARDDPRWTGVLVEPNPLLHPALEATIAGHPRLVLERAAVSDRDGQVPFFAVAPSPDLPAWAHGLSSFDRTTIERHVPRCPALARHVRETRVACVTPRALLARHGVDALDVLVVDAEGHDLVILAGFAPHLAAARLVIFERAHLSAADQARATGLLRRAGLTIRYLGENVVGYRP